MQFKRIGLFQMPTDAFGGNFKKAKEFISFWNSKWDWDDDLPLNKQGKAMRTFLVKRKILSDDKSSLNHPGVSDNASRKNYLNSKISIAAAEFLDKKTTSDNILFEAFNAIQYWGAITGRTFYTRNSLTESNTAEFYAEWVKNVKPTYLSIISELHNEDSDISKLIILFDKIDGLGVSFGTKHLHFWSKAFGWDNPLPIYDTNIFQLLWAEVRKNRYPTWSQYIEVVDEFNKLAAKINMSSVDVERAFFAYHAKVGIKFSNVVPAEFAKLDHTIVVNAFLNKRLITH
jgi:hypothetical protein